MARPVPAAWQTGGSRRRPSAPAGRAGEPSPAPPLSRASRVLGLLMRGCNVMTRSTGPPEICPTNRASAGLAAGTSRAPRLTGGAVMSPSTAPLSSNRTGVEGFVLAAIRARTIASPEVSPGRAAPSRIWMDCPLRICRLTHVSPLACSSFQSTSSGSTKWRPVVRLIRFAPGSDGKPSETSRFGVPTSASILRK